VCWSPPYILVFVQCSPWRFLFENITLRQIVDFTSLQWFLGFSTGYYTPVTSGICLICLVWVYIGCIGCIDTGCYRCRSKDAMCRKVHMSSSLNEGSITFSDAKGYLNLSIYLYIYSIYIHIYTILYYFIDCNWRLALQACARHALSISAPYSAESHATEPGPIFSESPNFCRLMWCCRLSMSINWEACVGALHIMHPFQTLIINLHSVWPGCMNDTVYMCFLRFLNLATRFSQVPSLIPRENL